MFKHFNKLEQAGIIVAVYVFLQMVSDIAATKVIVLGPLEMDAGMIYILTFTWRDLIHKRFGVRMARIAIILAALINILMAAYFYFVIQLPAQQEWASIGGQSAWEFIFGFVPSIVIASIVAEVVAELIDTETYSWWQKHYPDKPQWTRVLVSNTISIPIDSALFVGIAFSGMMSFESMMAIFWSNVAIKFVISLAFMWMIYLVKDEQEPQVKESGAMV